MTQHSAFWWFCLNLLSIIALSFYSMQEMACVSFNKIRLHYYVSKGVLRAIWVNYLIHNPSRLFGTTLIFVNVAMMVGSECSREFYMALGWNPDLALITQVIIVIIFAELAPMFAARRYPEHVGMLGAPIVYFSAKLITPFIWSIDMISKLVNFLIGGKEAHHQVFLNQDELQKILTEPTEEKPVSSANDDEFSAITLNIFNLRNRDAEQMMRSITTIPLIPSNATIGQAQRFFEKQEFNYLPVYHRTMTNIIGIAVLHNLIRAPNTHRVRDYAESPWFVTQSTTATQILKQFQRNKESIAIVLNDQGLAVGVLSLDDLIKEIFGSTEQEVNRDEKSKLPRSLVIDRSFPGNMKVAEFNLKFDIVLDQREEITLAELMEDFLGHRPELDESVYIAPFLLVVEETSLREIKRISITTRL